ncbi:uncharacterized protein LOC132716224 [Ruditapes philippinarum]|uniref:uncharacterized protein LOC132716224 n=1 Tax=Ruditapes philippinarum TaxID=129788 RepID=UPI00295B87EC|nr:uncharacterized protein LOC132716224 [Ruditapes philippinarum]
MTNISYIKGVKTRFCNVLEREISVAKDLLTCIVENDEEEEMELKISKCMEKLTSFIAKSGSSKFNYLKTKLFGEAKFAIAGRALSNENFKVAVDILLKRFGNSQEIIDLHYNELINMQPASNKVESFRCLSDKVERHLRSLEVLKQNVDQDIFVSILRSKLPEDVLIQLEIQKGVDVKWTVTRLNKQLQEYLVARERAVKEKVKDTKSKTEGHERNTSLNKLPQERYSSTRNGVTNMKSSATALVTTVANAVKKPYDTKMQCRYCQKAHWSDECNQYKTIRERKDRVKGSYLNV